MARRWFGYGRWGASYWFVGQEPGGDELDACVRAWHQLGEEELLDVQEGHQWHDCDLFSEVAGTQRTWAKLIWLVRTFEGKEPSREATLQYQKRDLGRKDGKTALIELSALPAHHNGAPVPREMFRSERIATIRERVLEYKPGFVVFYSSNRDYRQAWNAIAGVELQREAPVKVGKTVFVMTYHPSRERSKAYWGGIANKLQTLEGAKH
jgi:hypothetical protein